MNTPELIFVSLQNGDTALFVNGDAVLSLDASEAGQSPGEIGDYLAKALGVPLQSIEMAVPADDDWSWNDVYELLPTPKTTEVPVCDARVVIELDGGLVENIYTDRPGLTFVILDKDIEGQDDEDVVELWDDEYIGRPEVPAVNPEFVADAFTTFA